MLTTEQPVSAEDPIPFDVPQPEMGITLGEPAHIYHRRVLGVAHKSALDQMARSPMHYRAWVDVGDVDTAPFAFGRAFHMATLERDRFASTYIVQPAFGNQSYKVNKEAKAAWLAKQSPSAMFLEADDYADMVGMIGSIARHPAASRLMREGEDEVSLRWIDERTGLRCKARADKWIKQKRIVVDLKSCVDASPKEFARSVAKYRYHVQDASYRAGFHACGETINHFAIIAVEKKPPYACAVYTLDQDAVERGYHAYRGNIELLADCMQRNEWPAYSDGVEELSLPPWA